MKRFFPFLIIGAVALLTVGTAAVIYRVKTQPTPAPQAETTVTATPTEAPETPFLHVRGPHNATNVNYLFESYAESLGLDVARFRADRQSADVRAHVLEDGKAGEARGVKNTPTIFINGTQLRTGFTKDIMRETIEAALASGKKP